MLRRAGMHRVDFLQVLRRGSFKRINAGDSIIDLERDEVSLFLMIEVRERAVPQGCAVHASHTGSCTMDTR